MAVDTFVTVTIEPVQCGVCHAWFGLDATFHRKARESKKSFTCPYCSKSLSYIETENQRLRDELAKEKHRTEQAKADRDWWQGHANTIQAVANSTERRLRAHKGVVTKLKKRVSKGVCPCCHQKFKDLRDHMKAEHPDWNPEKGAEAIASKVKA